LELSSLERAVWQESWIELHIVLEQQRARLAVARMPADLLNALELTTLACWREIRDSADGDQPGISSELLDCQRRVIRAIRARLIQAKDRDRLRVVAIQEVAAAGIELPGMYRPPSDHPTA
jgi:hypothetical protein